MATFSYEALSGFSSGALNAASGGTVLGSQMRPVVVRLDASRFFLAYLSAEEGSLNRIETGIFSTNNFALLSGSIVVASAGADYNLAPDAARATDGDVTLGWSRQAGANTSIRLAVIDGDTGALNVADRLVDNAGSYNGPVSATPNGSGIMLAYGDNGWGTEEATLAFTNAGTTTFFAQVNNGNNNRSADLAAVELTNGNIATVFRDQVTGYLSMRVYTALGAVAMQNGDPIERLNFDTFGQNGTPRLAALPGGGFAVVYHDTGWTGGNAEITLALFKADGSNGGAGATLFVRVTSNAVEDIDPAVAVDANGVIAVAWTQRNATDDLYARHYTADGQALNPAPIVLAAGGADRRHVSIEATSADTLVVAYETTGGAGDSSGGSIRAARYDFWRTVLGDGTDEALNGGVGRDQLDGLEGNDSLSGGGGNDRLFGGGGADVLRGDAGTDETYGGPGDDQHVLTDAGDTALEGIGEGSDTAWVGGNGVFVRGSFEIVRLFGAANLLVQNVDQVSTGSQFVGNAGLATTISGTQFDDVFWGTDQHDNFTGLGGNDIFRAGAGLNTLAGGLGDDQYVIAAATDEVTELAGQGTETAWVAVNGWTAGANIEVIRLAAPGAVSVGGSATGEDIVANQGEASTLYGNGGNDVLWGSSFADSLFGGAGDDIMRGQGGADQMAGGTGNDSYVVFSAAVTITEAADAGYDTVWIDIPASTFFALAPNIERANLAGASNALIGNGLDNVLVGNPGSRNFLYGNSGNDLIFGSAAADVLQGDDGNDIMYSLGGADQFVYYDSPWGYDQISGFVQGQARLLFNGITFAQLTLNSANGNTQVEYNGNAILVFGVASMTAADFTFL